MKHYNIPIFVPHEGCPFDCVFCNQKHITGSCKTVDESVIIEIMDAHLKTLPRENCSIEAAFFGGSFTGIPMERQRRFLQTAYRYVQDGRIDGIRLSTRPDYIDRRILDQLREFGVTAIELGVQSMDETVLKAARRGHTAEDVKRAVQMIREYPFQLGLQMMTGLPEDTPEKSLYTAREIIRLKPDFVRIYPTLVVEDTALAVLYRRGEYRPQTLEEAVMLCKALLELFDAAKIPVIRVALMTTEEISPGGALVAGPFHPAFRELVEGELYFDKLCTAMEQGDVREVVVNSREVSKAVGNNKRNVRRIREQIGVDVKITGAAEVPPGAVYISGRKGGSCT